MSDFVKISGIGSISALGESNQEIWISYKNGKSAVRQTTIGNIRLYAAPLVDDQEKAISELKALKRYRALDRSVLLAIQASRAALADATWDKGLNAELRNIAVSIGSSRGATNVWERQHASFLEQGTVLASTSPLTTLGNISSWVGQDIKSQGLSISHSVTCSTGLHSIINAIAWLRSGLAKRVLAGASEASLTEFTFAQMQALRIYSVGEQAGYACRPLSVEDRSARINSLCLGEGACVAALELVEKPKAQELVVSGIGFYQEQIDHETAISEAGEGFYQAMHMALGSRPCSEVDLVVMHAPGTVRGDQAEINACNELFASHTPSYYSTKWALGHTFSASGMFSLEFAALCLLNGCVPDMPYKIFSMQHRVPKVALINSAGFGGNCVSILLERIDE